MNSGKVAGFICCERIPFVEKKIIMWANQTKAKMNNSIRIISIEVNILKQMGIPKIKKKLLNLQQKGYFDQVL